MSSPPQESETRTVDLTREQQWVVHHVLTRRLDDALTDEETSPPAWLGDVLETIEAGGGTFPVSQARRLHDALVDYLDGDPPSRDVDPASDVVDRLAD